MHTTFRSFVKLPRGKPYQTNVTISDHRLSLRLKHLEAIKQMENGTNGSLRVILPFPPCPILLTPIFRCCARTDARLGEGGTSDFLTLLRAKRLDMSWVKRTSLR